MRLAGSGLVRPADFATLGAVRAHAAGHARDHCAGMVINGRFSLLPDSPSVKKNIMAVSARLVFQSPSSIQNQVPGSARRHMRPPACPSRYGSGPLAREYCLDAFPSAGVALWFSRSVCGTST